ncbi:hypothetical protein V6N13_081551 [Hibiscus sabdariffa]|uniref:Regulator of Vps4 activity in the MVB pathway protein n=1 Tax=Hibiscus sabdariffa TaxID=183260 RepID=A0ABR2DDE9_9ROSI
MQKLLHKSFKPAKCKTALRMAIPRIKLMRNKREAQAKQLKRELAQLLVEGQDQTARIRVEHVVREEKTVEAYSLLEIYCELIVARMPIVESQKDCPIDLKEAIASVIYASKRCVDIPELKDASKHFTAKYGKEFTSAALDLRPDCGVGRMLAMKLAPDAPDGPTKLRILTAIAEEHNIEWDPASFGTKESKVYDDMLKGPNTFAEAAKVSAYPSNIQAPPGPYEQRSPSVQVPKHVEKNDMPTNFSENSSRSSPDPKNFSYSNTGADNLMPSGTYSPNSKPPGTGNEGFRHSYSGNESAYSSPRKHWNMDFKDATTAAQVAAESAELASMAARAAAELSSRGNTSQQYFMESPMSPLHHTRDEEPRKYTGSASQNESLGRRNSRNYERSDSYGQHNRAGDIENVYSNITRSGDKSTHGSFKSTASSFNEEPSVNNNSFRQVRLEKSGENSDHQNVRGREQSSYTYSRSQSNGFADDHDVVSSFNRLKSENDKRNSGESRTPLVNELHDTYNSDFADYQEVRSRKQSSCSSSHSRSSTFSDDHGVVSNLNHQNSGNNKGSLQRSTKEATYSFNNAAAVFDDYGSDNNEDRFDFEEEHEVHEFSMSSPTRPFTETKSWSTEKNVESRGKSFAAPLDRDDLPATFDDYGPSSESDKEMDKITIARSTKPSIGSNGKSMDSHQAGNSAFNPQFVEVMGDTELSNDSNPEEGMKLNFGNLTGGFRHKGYKLPPYTNSPLGNDASTRTQQSSPPAAVEASVGSVSYNQEPYSRERSDEVNRKLNMRAPSARVDPSDDDSEDERPKRTSSSTQDRYNKTPSIDSDEHLPEKMAPSITGFSRRTKASPNSQRSSNLEPTDYSGKGSDEVNRKFRMRTSGAHVDSSDDDSVERPRQTFSSARDQCSKTSSFEGKKRSSLRVAVPYFGLDEDLPKTNLNASSDTGFSRRTKASPSNSQRSSNLKSTVSSEPSAGSDYDESPPKTRHQLGSFSSQATSRLVSEIKRSSSDRTFKSSEKEQSSGSVPKIITSASAKSLTTQTSIGQGQSKQNASHVHPKLPDIDILTAHFNSIRQNRQRI